MNVTELLIKRFTELFKNIYSSKFYLHHEDLSPHQWNQEHGVCANVMVIRKFAKIYSNLSLLDILGNKICFNFSGILTVYFL